VALPHALQHGPARTQDRKTAWERRRVSISWYQQEAELSEIRADLPAYTEVHSQDRRIAGCPLATGAGFPGVLPSACERRVAWLSALPGQQPLPLLHLSPVWQRRRAGRWGAQSVLAPYLGRLALCCYVGLRMDEAAYYTTTPRHGIRDRLKTGESEETSALRRLWRMDTHTYLTDLSDAEWRPVLLFRMPPGRHRRCRQAWRDRHDRPGGCQAPQHARAQTRNALGPGRGTWARIQASARWAVVRAANRCCNIWWSMMMILPRGWSRA
jgi:hypothetical protein